MPGAPQAKVTQSPSFLSISPSGTSPFALTDRSWLNLPRQVSFATVAFTEPLNIPCFIDCSADRCWVDDDIFADPITHNATMILP